MSRTYKITTTYSGHEYYVRAETLSKATIVVLAIVRTQIEDTDESTHAKLVSITSTIYNFEDYKLNEIKELAIDTVKLVDVTVINTTNDKDWESFFEMERGEQ